MGFVFLFEEPIPLERWRIHKAVCIFMIIHQGPSFAPVGKQTTDRGHDFYNVVKGMTKIS